MGAANATPSPFGMCMDTAISDDKVLRTLVRQQQEKFPRILDELEEYGRKTSHWIWWACPTERPGDKDPIASYVTKETAALLLTSESAAAWQRVLEKLCDLIDESGTSVLPRIDHGRMKHFLDFWEEVPAKPVWMAAVLTRFRKFNWR